jgi:TonB family protein
MFAGVRKRVLPAMVRDRYRTVRRLIDDKQYAAAEPQLVEIHALLQAADQLGALDEGLSDLDVLVDGFLALARAQAERAAPSAVPAASSAAAPTGGGAPPPPPSAPPGPQIYGIEDADVTPPLVIDQRVPTVPPQLLTILRAQRRPALLTVVIDDSGNVQKAAIRGSVNAAYDDLLLRAANAWKYKPATRAGVPVWYERTVAVDVK